MAYVCAYVSPVALVVGSVFGIALLSKIAALSGLVGVVLLAVPAWYANSYARTIWKLSQMKLKTKDSAIIAQKRTLVSELEKLRDAWTLPVASCLYGGLGLNFLSYLLAYCA